MKRMHLHVGVEDIDQSVKFYSTLFAAEPTVRKPDYVKWMLEDPRVNFAITPTSHTAKGVEHIGIQVETPEELAEVHERLKSAGRPLLEEGATTCCYAQSEKNWITDPDGVIWETFLTNGEATKLRQQAARRIGNDRAGQSGPARSGECIGDILLRTAARVTAIVDAAPEHAPDIAAIYTHHVKTGTASFDTEGPSVDDWALKIADIRAHGWPFLITERDGSAVGFAYATQFRDRPAYAHTCENSIYVHPGAVGQGVGSMLMTALIEHAAAAGFHQMIAVIGGGEPASIALHAKAGFRHAGRMEKVGMKFGRLLDTVYMQRGLGVEHG